MERQPTRRIVLRRIGRSLVLVAGGCLAQCGEAQELVERAPFVTHVPDRLLAVTQEPLPLTRPLVVPPVIAQPPQGTPRGGLTTGIVCPVRGAEVLEGAVPAVDPARPTVRVGVGRSVRGPQLSQGASVFNVVATEDERCGVRVVGNCTVRDCRPPAARIGDMGDALTGASSGEVTVAGSGGQGPYFFAPRSNGTYPPAAGLGAPPSEVMSSDPPWREGDVVCVNGAGTGTVGAFQTRVEFPAPTRVLAPTLENPVDQILVISRVEPLTVRWEPVGETVVVSLNQRPANGTTPTWLEDLVVSCAFDGQAGGGAVAPALLSVFLSSEEGNSSGSLSISTRRETAAAVGGVRVVASASDGVSYRATFQ